MSTLASLIAAALLSNVVPLQAKSKEGVHSEMHEALTVAGFELRNKNLKGQAKYRHPKTGDLAHTNLGGTWHMRPGTSYTSKRGLGVTSLQSALKRRKYSVIPKAMEKAKA